MSPTVAPIRRTLLTSAEVADRLALSTKSVQRYARAGLLPAIRLRGGLRFDPIELEAFIEAHRIDGPDEDAAEP